ncbi:hypothetical protein ES705_22578 [subsurface metagenome]
MFKRLFFVKVDYSSGGRGGPESGRRGRRCGGRAAWHHADRTPCLGMGALSQTRGIYSKPGLRLAFLGAPPRMVMRKSPAVLAEREIETLRLRTAWVGVVFSLCLKGYPVKNFLIGEEIKLSRSRSEIR